MVFFVYRVELSIEIIKDDEIRKILGHLLTQSDNAVYEKCIFKFLILMIYSPELIPIVELFS